MHSDDLFNIWKRKTNRDLGLGVLSQQLQLKFVHLKTLVNFPMSKEDYQEIIPMSIDTWQLNIVNYGQGFSKMVPHLQGYGFQ
jgi:hypothetical protein